MPKNREELNALAKAEVSITGRRPLLQHQFGPDELCVYPMPANGSVCADVYWIWLPKRPLGVGCQTQETSVPHGRKGNEPATTGSLLK